MNTIIVDKPPKKIKKNHRTLYKRRQNKREKSTKKRWDKTNNKDDRFKPSKINNYNKYKWSKYAN